MFEFLRKIFRPREPSVWTVLDTWEEVRSHDGKLVGIYYVLQDQYGNIRQQKVGRK
jgi:hypothetical protein